MSQSELGAIADVGWTRIRNWEQGTRRPTRSGVERLVSALYTSYRWALGRVGHHTDEELAAMSDAEVRSLARSMLLDDAWEDLEENLLALLSTSVIDDGDEGTEPHEGIAERAREWGQRERMKRGRR